MSENLSKDIVEEDDFSEREDEEGVSISNSVADSEADEDEELDDEEMNDEDRKFIADDSSDEEAEDKDQSGDGDDRDEEDSSATKSKSHRGETREERRERKRLRREKRKRLKEKRHKARRGSVDNLDEGSVHSGDVALSESGNEDKLDEDDLELLRENMGYARDADVSSRSRSKSKRDAGALDDLFLQKEAAEEEDYDDDLDDFVVEDEVEGESMPDTPADRDQLLADKQSKIERQKSRRAFVEAIHAEFGISDQAWTDISDIFGDGTDYEDILMKQDQMRGNGQPSVPEMVEDGDDGDAEGTTSKTLEKFFEPAEIEERMLTEADELIREQDVPERLLTRSVLLPLSKDELPREAAWIARRLVWERELRRIRALDSQFLTPEERRIPMLGDVSGVEALAQPVGTIVSFIRSLKLEVPYIQKYREDYWSGKFSVDELWKIYDLDEKWQALEQRREKLFSMWAQMKELNPDGTYVDNVSVEESLETAASMEDLDDVVELFSARYATELQHLERSSGASQKKRLQLSPYEVLKGHRALEFMYQFGVDPLGYAKAYSEDEMLLQFKDPEVSPISLAVEYAEEGLDTADRILQAAKSALVFQLVSEPLIRRTIRKFLLQDACITVTPTLKGRDEIDEGHIFYGVKYLHEKPVKQMEGTDFLYIQQAEQLGLVEVSIRIMFEKDFVQDAVSFIRGDGDSVRPSWRKIREEAIEEALQRYLLPQLVKQVHNWLRDNATLALLDHVRGELETRLNMQPFGLEKVAPLWRKADLEGRKRRHPLPTVKVLSLTWGDGSRDTATVGVLMAGSADQVIDTLKLDNLQEKVADRKSADLAKIESFLEVHEPDAICIGGFTPQTRYLYTLVRDVAKAKAPDTCVVMVNDDFARIFMNSDRSRRKFPHLPQLMLYAVGLCRQLLDPLAFAATFANQDRELLLVNIDTSQSWISQELLYEHMQRALINVVSSVGVDLTEALQVEWKQALLQIVPGLGPRKATLLVAKSTHAQANDAYDDDLEAANSAVESREELLRHQWVGPNVYVNCAGFLRIPRRHFISQDASRIEILDNTLIHPEEYDFPRKMAADALDEEVVAYDGEDGGRRASEYVEELLTTDSAYKLDALELDDFAQWMRETKHVEKLKALEQIRRQLQQFDVDQRPVFRPARPEQVFQMLTGESCVVYRTGRKVSGSVSKVLDSGVSVRLNRGLFGFIPSRYLPRDVDPHTRFQVGMPVEAWVQFLDVEKFSVTLTLEEADQRGGHALDRKLSGYVEPDMQFWNRELEKAHESQQRAERELAIRQTVRPVRHPFFRDLPDFPSSAGFLMENPQMPYIIRSAGEEHNANSGFVITWRIYGETFVQVRLEPVNRDQEQPYYSDANRAQLAYSINGKVFQGFDEVHARFMQPLMHHVQLLLEHAKFHKHPLTGQPAGREITRGFLEQSYHASGGTLAVYRLCCDDIDDAPTHHRAVPGRFLLGIKNHKEKAPLFLVVNVSDQGYHLQGQVFLTVQLMIDYFKKQLSSSGRKSGEAGKRSSAYGKSAHGSSSSSSMRQGRSYKGGASNNPNSIPVRSSATSSW